MKKIIKNCRFIVLVWLVFVPSLLMAQFGGDDPGDDVDDTGNTNVPLDDNVYLLVAAGLGYGVFKEYKKREQVRKAAL